MHEPGNTPNSIRSTTARERILVVDDERDIQELIHYSLKRDGFVVYTIGTGEEALVAAEDIGPELIILDRMLPGMDGIEVCRHLKRQVTTRTTPVIMLTAKTEEDDIVVGLDAGADDYVTKPFSPKVLIARVRAALRRAQEAGNSPQNEIVHIHDITIDITRHSVTIGDRPVQLSATEFAILEFLSRRPGWVFSRARIIDGVKGENYPVTERSVDVQILGLRKKLGDAGNLIETVRGVGYRMRSD